MGTSPNASPSIDNKKFGAFVAALRREHGLTQRQLAEALFVSDKAVSKWERGLSLPDTALLMPLAGALGVTVTELLCGERLPAGQTLPLAQVEHLVTGSLALDEQQGLQRQADRAAHRRYLAQWGAALALAALLNLAGSALAGIPIGQAFMACGGVLLTTELLCAALGFFACFLHERLPAYYDENKIYSYDNGVFRLKLGFIRISNSNWPYIRRACFYSLAGILVAAPLLHYPLLALAPGWYWRSLPYSMLCLVLGGVFLPVYWLGWRHQQREEGPGT